MSNQKYEKLWRDLNTQINKFTAGLMTSSITELDSVTKLLKLATLSETDLQDPDMQALHHQVVDSLQQYPELSGLIKRAEQFCQELEAHPTRETFLAYVIHTHHHDYMFVEYFIPFLAIGHFLKVPFITFKAPYQTEDGQAHFVSLLAHACQFPNKALVVNLIECGSSHFREQTDALHPILIAQKKMASTLKHVNVMRIIKNILIQHCCMYSKMSPLSVAAHFGDEVLLRECLTSLPTRDLNVRQRLVNSCDAEDETALMRALKQGHHHIVTILVGYGADFFLPNDAKQMAVHFIFKHLSDEAITALMQQDAFKWQEALTSIEPQYGDARGNPPLYYTVLYNRIFWVRKALDKHGFRDMSATLKEEMITCMINSLSMDIIKLFADHGLLDINDIFDRLIEKILQYNLFDHVEEILTQYACQPSLTVHPAVFPMIMITLQTTAINQSDKERMIRAWLNRPSLTDSLKEGLASRTAPSSHVKSTVSQHCFHRGHSKRSPGKKVAPQDHLQNKYQQIVTALKSAQLEQLITEYDLYNIEHFMHCIQHGLDKPLKLLLQQPSDEINDKLRCQPLKVIRASAFNPRICAVLIRFSAILVTALQPHWRTLYHKVVERRADSAEAVQAIVDNLTLFNEYADPNDVAVFASSLLSSQIARADEGRAKIVKQLLEHKSIRNCITDNRFEFLIQTIDKNNAMFEVLVAYLADDTVKELFSKVVSSDEKYSGFHQLFAMRSDILKADPKYCQKLLQAALCFDRRSILVVLFRFMSLDNQMLRIVITYGTTDQAIHLLQNYTHIRDTAHENDNAALRLACKAASVSLVRELLSCPAVVEHINAGHGQVFQIAQRVVNSNPTPESRDIMALLSTLKPPVVTTGASNTTGFGFHC